ncbi:Synaptogyrin-1 [Pitangus sulphuratus]|nr:Synaptogyrin-1 [Pitangus sulphuratus]
MDGGAFGAGKAGGAFDPQAFIRQPQTLLRFVSWIFSIVVFGSIVNEGYVNRLDESEEHCIFNRNHNACNYGITVGVLAFLSCLLYLALDAYFPQISSVKDRKKAVLSDIGVSVTLLACSSHSGKLVNIRPSPEYARGAISGVRAGSDEASELAKDIGLAAFWAFLWFVGFCFLTNQWQASKEEDNPLNEGGDAARAAITFSFFSIFTWVGQAFLAYQRFQLGADSALFSQDYMDPSQDSGMPYAPYTNEEDATDAVGTYQQPPPADAFDTETQGYQTQNY